MTDAQKQLAESNMKLVWGVIHRKFPWLAENEDVVSVGNLALCKAAQTYEPGKGIAFSTYAWTVIKNDICGFIRKDVKIKGHERTPQADSFGDEDDDTDIFDYIGDEDKGFESFEISEDFENVISELPEKWQIIVRGIMCGKTFQKIANEMGISKQYVNVEFKRAARRILERLEGYDD